MKRDMDLIRKILLKIEESNGMFFVQGDPDNEDYERHCYHIELLKEAGFLKANITKADGGIYYSCSVTRLTWEGHEFLDNIRDNKVWEEVKNKISKASESVSLSIISNIANTVIMSMLS